MSVRTLPCAVALVAATRAGDILADVRRRCADALGCAPAAFVTAAAAGARVVG